MSEIMTPVQENILRAALARRKLELYRPRPKQIEFHNATANYLELLLKANNQGGKTYCAAAMVAMHAIGVYPDWYTGRKLKKASVIWCAGVTGGAVRDTIQRLLIGDTSNPDTGFLPAGTYETMPSRGVPGLMDTIIVNHVSGSKSRITFKSYDQQREKFQGDSVDFVWLDEEPDENIYLEALTRTNATGGQLIMTFTPLKGFSGVVKRFLREKSPERHVVSMTIDDMPISAEEKEILISRYAPHERQARIYGNPVPGTGQIFQFMREDISCKPLDPETTPFYWSEIAGLDFGWNHPTAACKLLYNTQDDIIYVTNTYRRKEATPMVHAAALKAWGDILFAWPHDGLQHDKGSGMPLKDIYIREGLNMLPDNARFDDGGNGVVAGLEMMRIRFETGKLKIYAHLTDLFEEIDGYYMDDGKVNKVDDDLICALRYAIMCLRFAKRVNKPPKIINGYIHDENRDYGKPEQYNPLGHEYINRILGIK